MSAQVPSVMFETVNPLQPRSASPTFGGAPPDDAAEDSAHLLLRIVKEE